jgi:hypothetical protein
MKKIIKSISAIALSLILVSVAQPAKVAEKVNRNYINIKSLSEFNNQIKRKDHSVVLFFDRADMGEGAYNKVKQAFDRAADIELYKDKKNLQFLKVNTGYKDNLRIFQENRVLASGEIAEKPVILLFRNKGKMIDNQLSGDITEEHVRRFVENYFTDLRKKEAKPTRKKPARTKKMKSSMYGG